MQRSSTSMIRSRTGTKVVRSIACDLRFEALRRLCVITGKIRTYANYSLDAKRGAAFVLHSPRATCFRDVINVAAGERIPKLPTPGSEHSPCVGGRHPVMVNGARAGLNRRT